jgi:hypothetical protein
MNQTFTIDVKNVIADGSGDVFARASGGPNAHAFITLTHSSYDNYGVQQSGTGNTAGATAVGGDPTNVAATPNQMFVCAPGCGLAADFHQIATSPTINAGLTDSLTGTTDFEGTARPQGAAMDIGAYERPEAAPPAGGGGGTTNPPGATPKKKCKKKKRTRAAAAKKCKKRKK